jgi:hypothetical protein
MDRMVNVSLEFRGGHNYSLDGFIDAFAHCVSVLSALWCRLADAVEETFSRSKSSPLTEGLALSAS